MRNALRMWGRAAGVVLLGAAGAFAAPDASAQRSIEFPRFDATIEVEEDGTVRVLEQIQVRFNGSWNGIFRKIPVTYETPQGFGYKLFLDVESVTNPNGEPLEHWIEDDRGYRSIKIRVPGAQDADKVVWIRYSAPNALRFHEDFDELYWNVTGTEWDVPIQAASARVVLPDGVSGTRTAAFTGYFGATGDDARVEDLGSEFLFETTRELGFREGLTIAVGWDPGQVTRPSSLTKAWWFLRSNILLLLPILPVFFFYRAWSTRGRDPRTGTIVAQYEPPDGLRPAEIGTLIDNKPNMHDLTATLVDLAVRGYLRFEEVEKKGFLRKSSEVHLHRVKDRRTWVELREHERRTLVGVFDGNEDVVALSDLKDEYYTHLGGIKDSIWDHLLEKGYYEERPDKVAGVWIGGALVVTAVVFIGGLILADRFFLSAASAIVAGILTAIPSLIFAGLMPARTRQGVATLERVLGFEEFLSRVDGDRIRRMNVDPETFEQLLPYAMALKAEDRWAKAFEGIYTEPPQWYTGAHHHGAFTPRLFVSDLGGFARSASSTMASSPSRSSSGSGFSSGGGGGGFSGGGFGGGGGGGW